MGTENYKLADYEGNTDQSVFNKAPVNLRANREKSHVNKNDDKLSKTQNHEALVEYFITKWQYSHDGSLRKVRQSASFKFQSRFKPHKDGQMELSQTADGK